MSTYQPDHYRLLGVAPNANLAAIKENYHQLCRVFHPDRQQGSRAATVRFQQISTAYSELSNPARREHYDRLLMLRDPLRFIDSPRAERALDAVDTIVSRLRRDQKILPRTAKGRDLRTRATIGLREAVRGGLVEVLAQYKIECPTCEGRCTQQPERNPNCHVCHTQGQLVVGIRRGKQKCGFCEGLGVVLLAPCRTCDGGGVTTTTKRVKVDVPARCEDGAVLRVRGAGESSSDGKHSGDLVVDVTVAAHPLLEVDGDDVLCHLPVSWAEAVCGCIVTVPTLDGIERLTVPAGISNNQEIRIANQGLPSRTGQGDLRYRIQIDTPSDLDAEQREQVARLEQRLGLQRFGRRRAFRDAVNQLADKAEQGEP